MQSTAPTGIRARFLYYWAKGFANSIVRGDEYTQLRPCVSILWFKVPLLRAAQFHSTFVVADLNSLEILSPELQIHVLELPKLHLAPTDSQARLCQWARFLRATNVEELDRLAQEDPTMNTAKKTLEELSQDPEARRIASDREAALLMHRHLLAASREDGLAEGEAKGRVEGARETLVRLLSKRFGPLPTWAEAVVVQARAEQLQICLDAVLTEQSLESVLNRNA